MAQSGNALDYASVELKAVKEIGRRIMSAVNQRYKCLEIDICR